MIRKLITKWHQKWPNSSMGKLAVIVILIWVGIALFSPFIANNKPILIKNDSGWSMPIYANSYSQDLGQNHFAIYPILNYRYDDLDLDNTFKPPFSHGKNGIHLLGTDKIGRDVAAGMVNGARVAFVVSTTAILLSAIIGIFIGLLIGYYGDRGIRRNIFQQIWVILMLIYFFYYLIYTLKSGFSIYSMIPIVLLTGLAYGGNWVLEKLPLKKYGLPIDILVQRLFEIRESVPGLFIILAFAAIFAQPTLLTTALIMAFLMWMTFARYARAEALQLREEAYIQSARATGMSDFHLLIHHILPNALPSLLVIGAFSFSGVILLESTLSFLGIGLPLEEVSWGKLLAEARKSPKAWWLAVFPGLAIFLVLYAFNTLGDIMANYQRNQK